MKTKARLYFYLILLLILPLVVISCGGDGDKQETKPSSQPTQSSAEQPTPGGEQPTLPPEATPPPAQQEAQTAVRPADGMEMILIPAGEFLMGDDNSAFAPERPGHLVTLDDYWMDRTELTNAQYRLCVEAEVCAEPRSWSNADISGDDQPALVTWEGARTYCEWVGGRLPTEAEWEKAVRGTDGRLWPWGDEFEPNRANLSGNQDGYGPTAPVGSFPGDVSSYGLLDAAGNAGEWVADWHDAEYYAHSPAHNPTGPASGEKKVHRAPIANAGGGPEKCRTVARYAADPNWEFGFRCAATTPPQGEPQASLPEQPATDSGETTPSDLTGAATGMEGLDSYRMRMTTRMPNLDGSGWGPDEVMEMEWVREPEASRIVMTDASGNVQMEIISIGDDTWMNMGDTWMHMPADQDAPAEASQFDLDDILQDLQGGMTLLGEETVNGVHCKHYAVDSEMSIEMPDPATGSTSTVTAHIKGEMWLADEGALPTVVIRSRAETEMTLFGDTPMTVYEERDVYDINAPITIEPPQ